MFGRMDSGTVSGLRPQASGLRPHDRIYLGQPWTHWLAHVSLRYAQQLPSSPAERVSPLSTPLEMQARRY